MIIGLFLNGCSSDNPCRERMNKARRELGEPDYITKFSTESPKYYTESWMWYSKGLSYTWNWFGHWYDAWGNGKKHGCFKSTFTFESIEYPITKLKNAFIDSTKTLISSEIFDRDCIFCP